MNMSGNQLSSSYSSDVDELVASMISDLTYWRTSGNNDVNGTKCRLIYKVLQCNRASDPNAYEPRVLSIGPYHHGVPSLLPMEKEKWFCLDYVLKWNSNRSLHDYLAVVTAVEREARICYSEDNIRNSRTFVEMLLLDSCFILVCLNGIAGIKMEADVDQRSSQGQGVLTEIVVGKNEPSKKGKEIMSGSASTLSCRGSDDFVLKMEQNQGHAHQQSNQDIMETYNGQSQECTGQSEQWYNSSAVYDLLLLENQIPFFVVTKIFELLVDDESTTHRLLTDNLAKFIEGVLLHLPLSIQDTNRPKDFDHLLHLCYMYFKPSCNTQQNHHSKKRGGNLQNFLYWGFKYLRSGIDSEEIDNSPRPHARFEDTTYAVKQLKRWRRAEEYHEAGIEFTERMFDEHNPHSLLDIEYRNGLLHIPCLPIDDKSATLFRNLLAFEQSCPALGNDIASYVYFMSQLISLPDDVSLLARKGVLVHQLDSDEEVSSLFSKLFEYVVYDFSAENYLKSLCQTLEAHYQNRLNRWMAWLWHKHFSNPWLGFTALASILMVFCSIGQTILAFLSYMSMS